MIHKALVSVDISQVLRFLFLRYLHVQNFIIINVITHLLGHTLLYVE